uniref:hypothetical protein n=1 Tax=Pedobacter schmidteae TaxID=2201271 RepID=UPI000EB2A969|nr:hypothetical protein [Pedobacter schmidteae]
MSKNNTGLGKELPPKLENVIIYFSALGIPSAHAQKFYKHNTKMKWLKPSGAPIRNWKTFACDWIFNLKNVKRYHIKNVFP